MMKRTLLLIACACVAGCVPHMKNEDAYSSMFRQTTPPQTGDPYTFGGIGEGSGGLMAREGQATDNDAPDFRDATATGQLGEIAKNRTETPGALPGAGAPINEGSNPVATGQAPELPSSAMRPNPPTANPAGQPTNNRSGAASKTRMSRFQSKGGR